MKNLFKLLIISILYVLLYGCKSQSNINKKNNLERTDTTNDLRDEQMQDYDQEIQQQNN